MKSKIRVAIVESNVGYQTALEAIIKSCEDMEYVGTFGLRRHTGLLQAAEKADVVLLGLSGDEGGMSLQRQLSQLSLGACVLVLGDAQDSDTLLQCLTAGAVGYVPRTTPWTGICDAVREAAEGGSPFSPQIAARVVKLFQSMAAPAESTHFSGRECQVVDLLRQRKRNKDIAVTLNLSVPTVRSHLRTIYLKMRVHTRSEAIQRLQNHPSHQPGSSREWGFGAEGWPITSFDPRLARRPGHQTQVQNPS